jgi:hypothetical protein
MGVCVEGQDKLIMQEGGLLAGEEFFDLLEFMGTLNKERVTME